MVFDIPTVIEHASRVFRLDENDLILMGTPEGVSAVAEGEVLQGTMVDNDKVVSTIEFDVRRR